MPAASALVRNELPRAAHRLDVELLPAVEQVLARLHRCVVVDGEGGGGSLAVDEASRRLLHERAAAAWGAEAAAVLMDHLPPAGRSDLARRGDVEHQTALLRSEMAAMSAGLRGEMATAIASQTRWMVTMLALLGALFTTATVLAG